MCGDTGAACPIKNTLHKALVGATREIAVSGREGVEWAVAQADRRILKASFVPERRECAMRSLKRLWLCLLGRSCRIRGTACSRRDSLSVCGRFDCSIEVLSLLGLLDG